jgi:hypothetical protein
MLQKVLSVTTQPGGVRKAESAGNSTELSSVLAMAEQISWSSTI